jgi:hypothetical protein
MEIPDSIATIVKYGWAAFKVAAIHCARSEWLCA